jgi:pyruvate-ferredoxin/flavodoxin oxidoreductase
MPFRKRDIPDAPLYPGIAEAMDGMSAVRRVETHIAQVIAAHPRWMGGSVDGRHAVRVLEEGGALAGVAAGAAAVGQRAVGLSYGHSLHEMGRSLTASSSQHLGYVVHHLVSPEDGSAMAGSWATIADCGAFVFAARSVQEAADLSLIARRVSETALMPSVCLLDESLTDTSVQTLRLPERDLIDAFLGHTDQLITSPAAAQAMIFGEKRRRLPMLLDADRPLGNGMTFDGDLAGDVVSARDVYLFSERDQLVTQAMAEFTALTHRPYATAGGCRLEGADFVVVAYGGIVEELEAVVDYLRKKERLRVGVINLSVLRPFPGRLLSHLLKGRKGVTVLDAADHRLSDDLRLTAEIRTAIDRGVENGERRKEGPIFNGYASYDLKDRPRLYSARYTLGSSRPGIGDLRALFDNMLPGRANRRYFHLGVSFERPHLRIPAAQRRQQAVRLAYPDIFQRALAGPAVASEMPRNCGTVQIRGDDAEIGQELARAFFHGAGWRVRTAVSRNTCTIAHSPTGLPPEILRRPTDLLALPRSKDIFDVSVINGAAGGSMVLVGAGEQPDDLWRRLPRIIRRLIGEKRLRIGMVDIRAIAGEVHADASLAPWMAAQALAGGIVGTYDRLDARCVGAVTAAYRDAIERRSATRPDVMTASIDAFQRGIDGVRELRWQEIEVDERPVAELSPPITATNDPGDESVFSLAHAWATSGYLIETGRRHDVLPDPALASRTAPACSSTFRSTRGDLESLPRLSPEICTACGECWSWCPEGAIVTSVYDLGRLVNTAIDSCKEHGMQAVQLPRVTPHLVKQAHKLFAADGLNRYLVAGTLLDDAFAWVLEKMAPPADKRRTLEEEYALVRGQLDALQLIKTDLFFRERERESQGTGLLFSLSVDPDACKSCGLCAAVCSESALEMIAAVEADAPSAAANRDLLRMLPDVPVEQLDAMASGEARSEVLRFINREVSNSIRGGDEGPPGNGPRTALRLTLGAIVATLQPGVVRLRSEIGALIDEIKGRLQETVNGAVRIRDFDNLAYRLRDVGASDIDTRALAQLLGSDHDLPRVRAKLQQLADRLAELYRLRDSYASDGRPCATVVIGTGRDFRWQHAFPYNPHASPWIFHLERDGAELAEGALEGLLSRMADTFRCLRLARLQLDDTYCAFEHDTLLESFSWRDFSDEEWAACPALLVVADRYTPGVSRLLRSDLPVKVLLINTQQYASQDLALAREEPALAAITMQTCFVLQATPANASHLIDGVGRGVHYRGPAIFHLYAADPWAHGVQPVDVAAQTFRKVQSRAFPLFTYDPARGREMHERLSLAENEDVERDFGQRLTTVELPNTLRREVAVPVTFGDWAARELRFREEFRFVPKKDWTTRMIPLAEFITLSPDRRVDHEPYVLVPGGDGRDIRKVASQWVVAETEAHLATWRLLLEMAGVRSSLADRLREEARAEMEDRFADRTAELQADFKARLHEQDQDHAARYLDVLKQQLLELSGFGSDPARREMALRDLLAMHADGIEGES